MTSLCVQLGVSEEGPRCGRVVQSELPLASYVGGAVAKSHDAVAGSKHFFLPSF